MIELELRGAKVELDEEEWTCEGRKDLEDILSIRYTYDSLEGYSPFPDLSLAKLAIKELGGKITEIVDPPEFVEGRVY